VVQLVTLSGDLTGSQVVADRPVQVIGGHFTTQVPHGITAADHLEESMFPVETLGRRYLVAAPATDNLPQGKVRVVRIIATEAATTLSYDPPQSGASTSLASPGQFVELALTRASFEISADKKILVAEYMTGSEAEGHIGDPALSLAVPIEQYRSSYQVHAPQNYLNRYVNVIAPVGASISVDDVPLTGFEPIGATGFGVLRYALPARASGNYVLEGNAAFAVTVYGYGSWTSYYYPGGLDLETIVVE